jgi:hypothetical protein
MQVVHAAHTRGRRITRRAAGVSADARRLADYGLLTVRLAIVLTLRHRVRRRGPLGLAVEEVPQALGALLLPALFETPE